MISVCKVLRNLRYHITGQAVNCIPSVVTD